jgi:hypothetical protein
VLQDELVVDPASKGGGTHQPRQLPITDGAPLLSWLFLMARRPPCKKSSFVFVPQRGFAGRCPPLNEGRGTGNGDTIDLLGRFDLLEGKAGEETLEVVAFEVDEHVRL